MSQKLALFMGLIILFSLSTLSIGCGESLFKSFADDDSNEVKLEKIKSILDETDPDYDEALELLDELIISDEETLYYQLKAATLLAKGNYDIFDILENSFSSLVSDDSSSSNDNNTDSTSNLSNPYFINSPTRRSEKLVMLASDESSGPSLAGAADGTSELFITLSEVLPDPTDTSLEYLNQANTVLNQLKGDAITAGVKFQQTLISTLIIVQNMKRMVADFDLSDFDFAETPEDVKDLSLDDINQALSTIIAGEDIFVEAVEAVTDNIDIGGCQNPDGTEASKNGEIEMCELDACTNNGDCFQ